MAFSKPLSDAVHVSVLPTEVVECFARLPESLRAGWIVDGTVGMGGHSELLLEAMPAIRVLGGDHDPAALELAAQRLARFGARARLVRTRLSDLTDTLAREAVQPVVGLLVDLGVSSLQLDTAERGFSFQHDGPLDMRMDPARERSAADIVNTWDEEDLADLFYHEGGETMSRRIAKAIVESRRRAPFRRTGALADCVAKAVGRAGGKIHPATKTFQALRRAVNAEGDELLAVLSCAEAHLGDGGVLVAISFHSGEDGEVKRWLAARAKDGAFEVLTKKPLEAGVLERRSNPRSRSARLRAAVRTRRQEDAL